MPKLLIVAYYFPPYPLVGAFRAAGFHRYLPEFGWETHVVTATTSAGEEPELGVTRFADDQPRSLPGIQDPSASWAWRNRKAIAAVITREKPDAVLITGGPFLYFSLGPWIRRKFGLPFVLDFRDPFLNPRHPSRFLRDRVARFLERRWTRSAAAILIPIAPMRGDVQARHPEQIHVVENGFDDHVLTQLPPAGSLPGGPVRTVVYAGKFRENASPLPLLQALKELEGQGEAFRFMHLGVPASELQDAARAQGMPVEERGLLPYLEALRLLRASDIGIVYSEGHPFEATTKVYDYIAVGKPILGIGVHPDGGIHEILKRYGAYRICPNEPRAIASALRDLLAASPSTASGTPSAAFGRRYQTKRLAEILEQIIP